MQTRNLKSISEHSPLNQRLQNYLEIILRILVHLALVLPTMSGIGTSLRVRVLVGRNQIALGHQGFQLGFQRIVQVFGFGSFVLVQRTTTLQNQRFALR